MPGELYLLRLNCGGCKAEAWMNGVPVTRVEEGGFLLDCRPVHEYLVPGLNKLLLVVEPGAHPSRPFESGTPFVAKPRTFATLQLLQSPLGVLPDHPSVQTLAAVEWRPEEGSSVEPPVMREVSVNCPTWLPRWSWLDATPMKLTPELEAYVFKLLQHLAAAFAKGDPSLYARAAEPRFREIAMAYGKDVEEVRKKFLDQWARVSTKAEFQMVTPTRETMALRLGAGGRIIDCVDVAFEPVVRAAKRPSDGATPLRFPIKLAAFGNDMRIVR